ncbi:MAG: hypothetical protein HY320_10255 [Armatimonadetes bacterium]|nr:hypothetical protein [Armatimonadota bacterium]
MSRRRRVVEWQSLKRVEGLYRQRLENDPTDMIARISLAWCLLMLALHQAGRESILMGLLETTGDQDELLANRIRSILDQDAYDLLRDSLRQALTVRQLSLNPQDQTDAAKLQELIELSGGSEAVSEAEAEAAEILAAVTRDILQARRLAEKSPQRLPTRRDSTP